MDNYGYTPFSGSHTTKGSQSQKYGFDSPTTIAKQQMSQQQGGLSAPPPPPLPKQKAFFRESKLTLKTRDWSSQPFGQQQSNITPSSSVNKTTPPFWRKHSTIASSSTSSPRTPSLLGVYDPTLLSGQTQPSSSSSTQQVDTDSLPQGFSSGSSSGFPTTNYQPSSTIPLHKDYHLPSSRLAQQSATPSTFDAPLSKDFNTSGLNNQTVDQSGWSQGSTPAAPALFNWDNWNRNRGYSRSRGLGSGKIQSLRPLRTRNWGSRSADGWSGYQPNTSSFNNLGQSSWWKQPNWNQGEQGLGQSNWNQGQSSVGQSNWNQGQSSVGQSNWNQGQSGINQSSIPTAPSLANFSRQRKWYRSPYNQQIRLRTRNWGTRDEHGWSNFNRGIFMHDQALHFNNKGLGGSQNFAPISQQRGLSSNIAPISQQGGIYSNTQATPFAQALAPLTGGAPTGRRGRRLARKEAKMAAIQQKLTTNLNAPAGDPAVNHYRRGAPVTVPLVGPNTGLASNSGSVGTRRRGRRNNLSRRNRRGRVLPVPATQPSFVTPVVAPIGTAQPIINGTAQYPNATYRTLYNNQGTVYPSSQYAVQPSSGFSNLYSSQTQQISPLSSTFGTAPIQQTTSVPIYSAQQPVVGTFLEKKIAPAQVFVRPTGSATF